MNHPPPTPSPIHYPFVSTCLRTMGKTHCNRMSVSVALTITVFLKASMIIWVSVSTWLLLGNSCICVEDKYHVFSSSVIIIGYKSFLQVSSDLKESQVQKSALSYRDYFKENYTSLHFQAILVSCLCCKWFYLFLPLLFQAASFVLLSFACRNQIL